jgi:hypothetical protein
MTAWIFVEDGSAAQSTIFSKDKNDYSGADKQNLLDIVLLNGGKLGCRQYLDNTEHFAGACESDAAAISDNTWYYMAISFEFEGVDTSVKMYLEGTLIKTIVGAAVILEDRDTYANAWLHMATATSVGFDAEPENVLTGFIYRFRLYNNLFTDFPSEIETNAASCQGCVTGTFCPQFNGLQCLWSCGRDEL